MSDLISIRLITQGPPEDLHKSLLNLSDELKVDCDFVVKHAKQRSLEPLVGGAVILTFGTAFLAFLTEVLKLINKEDTKSDVNFNDSNVQINNITINLDAESIKSLQEDNMPELPPELLKTLIANSGTDQDSDSKTDH